MDARISDVMVTLDKKYHGKFNDVLAQLKKTGLDITSADNDNGVVEGTIDVVRVRDLEKLDSVDYVRTVFTYDADFPPGDPRDRDGNAAATTPAMPS